MSEAKVKRLIRLIETKEQLLRTDITFLTAYAERDSLYSEYLTKILKQLSNRCCVCSDTEGETS